MARRDRAPLSWPRRLLFVGVIVLGELALVEVGSSAALWTISGEFLAPGTLQRRRASSMDSRARPELDLGAGAKWHREHVIHPYLGYVRNREFRGQLNALPEGFRVNEFGMVDQGSPLRPKEEGEALVGITGGSVAAMFRWHGTEALEAELWRRGLFEGKQSIRFVSCAIGGYKQPQQMMTVQYLRSLGVDFDAIVNIDGFNEVALHHGSNANKGVHPSFPRGWFVASTGNSNAATLPLIRQITLLEKTRRQLAKKVDASAWRHSNLGNLLWFVQDRQVDTELTRAQQELHQLVIPPSQVPFVARGPSAGRKRPPSEEVWATLIGIWERSSLQLHHQCEAAGIRYYHFLQPNQYIAPGKPMSADERQIAIREDHPYRAGAVEGYPQLQEAGERLRAAGVRFHDLTGIFAEVEEPLYIDDCCHLNDRGNELMAEAIAQRMEAGRP